MEQFITGKTYATRSICNHDCVFKFTIERRSKNSVWIDPYKNGNIVRRKLTTWEGKEMFYPLGRYSMAPIIRADDMAGAT